jgi:hypothetical protein
LAGASKYFCCYTLLSAASCLNYVGLCSRCCYDCCAECEPKRFQAALAVNENDHGFRFGLSQKLERQWAKDHEMLNTNDTPPLQRCQDAFQPALCHRFGVCVCSGPGEQAYHFNRNLVFWLRRYTYARRKKKTDPKPKQPPARALLDKAFVVIKLSTRVGRDSNSDDDLQSAADLADGWGELAIQCLGNCLPAEEETSHDVWLHFSYVNFSTFDFTVLQLHSVGEPSADGRQAVAVADEPVFGTAVEMFSKVIDFDKIWIASWYTIKSDDHLLTSVEMAPNSLQLLPMKESDLPGGALWRGSKDEKASRDELEKQKKARELKRRRDNPQPAVRQRRVRRRLLGDGDRDGGGAIDADPNSGSDHSPEPSDHESSDNEPEWMFAAELAEIVAGKEHHPDGSHPAPPHPEPAPPAPPLPEAPSPPPYLVPVPADQEVSARGRQQGPRRKEVVEEVLEAPGGDIRYNPKSNSMTAHCKEPNHGDCRRQRICSGRAASSADAVPRSGQGRPIGLLLAWLGDQANHDTAESHKTRGVHLYATRAAARDNFMSLPGAADFCKHERPKHALETDEPLTIK